MSISQPPIVRDVQNFPFDICFEDDTYNEISKNCLRSIKDLKVQGGHPLWQKMFTI